MAINLVERARRSCAISADAMADKLGVSNPTYAKYENDPSTMTIGQFFAMMGHLDSFGKATMRQYMEERLDAAESV